MERSRDYRHYLRSAGAGLLSAAAMTGTFGGEAVASQDSERNLSDSCPQFLRGPHPSLNKYNVCRDFILNINGYPGAGDEKTPLSGSKIFSLTYERSHDPYNQKFARILLSTHFLFKSRETVNKIMEHWPESTYKVEEGNVTVTGVEVNKKAKRAFVTSDDTWIVRDMECQPSLQDSCITYEEIKQRHVRTLCKVRNGGADNYAVVEEFRQPKMNCLKVALGVSSGRFK